MRGLYAPLFHEKEAAAAAETEDRMRAKQNKPNAPVRVCGHAARRNRLARLKRELPLHLMLLVPLLLLIIYSYGPMIGLVMGFLDYVPSNKGFFQSLAGSDWVGLKHFKYMLYMPDVPRIIWNTFYIAILKIAAKIIFPLGFAILLNEVKSSMFRKGIQTITFLPYFLSWVILGGILLDLFSPRGGMITNVLAKIGIDAPYFFGDPRLFPYMLVGTDLWKEIGFNTIIFLAALTGIDSSQLEAAAIDGAGRFKQITRIILPSIKGMIILVTILGLGNIMNAGFDQVFMLYNPMVYSTGDIIDTYTYRMGMENGKYSLATAVGMFKSVVTLTIMAVSYKLANKFSGYRIF